MLKEVEKIGISNLSANSNLFIAFLFRDYFIILSDELRKMI